MFETKINKMSNLKDKINVLQSYIDSCKNDDIVFFGGAGVSTESGVPDFRSKNGLYAEKYKYPPEQIISHSFFYKNTKEFYKYYTSRMLPLDKKIKPNPAHIFLKNLEDAGKLRCVITQNIDGLHQSAGSKKVLELHGSVHRNYCTSCNHFYTVDELCNLIEKNNWIPKCRVDGCTGIIKPDVVLYEEMLDNNTIDKSIMAISSAKLLIIAGTSLTVYPACGLINYFRGDKICLINKTQTQKDDIADLVIEEQVGKVFSKLHT